MAVAVLAAAGGWLWWLLARDELGGRGLATTAQAFRSGDFVQTARKAQFHESRTQWHDLLGHHCPRFGVDRLVALPIPKPKATLKPTDDYKLQLSFDGDRHMTHWLSVIGKRAPEVPLVEVVLRRSGSELLGVSASVHDAPAHYKAAHEVLVAEFRNASHWPKHVLVHYSFDTRNDVDLDRGLYVLFAIGLSLAALLIFNAMRGMRSKLAQFLQDVTSEGSAGVTAAPGSWKQVAKAE
ncbi:MAG: hypothetical protein WDW36_005545 [Sanguina aurantia]